MGLFKGKASPYEALQRLCSDVSNSAKVVRERAGSSLRGRYEYMRPEERADLLREAHEESLKLKSRLDEARSVRDALEAESDANEEILAAESLLLAASLDATEADKSLAEARNSLVQGMSEVESFYGPRSKEARHLRKVLSQFQASA